MNTSIKTLLLLLLPIVGYSQSVLTGKIIDASGPIVFANVILSTPDGKFIQGVTTGENGSFELKIDNGVYQMTINHLNYQTVIKDINVDGNAQLDPITLVDASFGLDEIVVKAKRPEYIQRSDGTLEILVENTSLSSTNSVNEMLSRSPEVLAGEDGGFAVFGKGQAIIYLNGKRVSNSQIEGVAPTNIKKIEIIRNPSAKYDADGAAVINITTIRQIDNGYQGKIIENISYSPFGGFLNKASLNINYKKDKISLRSNYALQLGQLKERLFTSRDRLPADGFLTTDLTTEWEYDFQNHSHYGLGFQYDINKKSYFSIDYSGYLEDMGGNTLSDNTIVDEVGSNFYDTNTAVDENDLSNSVSINYNVSLDTMGSSVFIGGQYSNFDINADNYIAESRIEQEGNSTRLIRNLLNLDIDVYSGQVDYTKAFSPQASMDIGLKYSHIQNNFDFDFLTSPDGLDFTLDENISNVFNYQENISAAYFNYKIKLNDKVNVSIGSRIEHTSYTLSLSESQDDKIEDAYFNVFPNFSIDTKLSSGQTLNFSYTSNILRPPYQRLNPVLIFQDTYTSSQGNSDLKPQTTHSFELNTKVKKTTLRLGYNYTIDPLGRSAIRGAGPRDYILKSINYAAKHEFYTSASRKFTINRWTSINTLSVRYINYLDDEHAFKKVKVKPNPYLFTNNIFKINETLKAEVLFSYRGQYHEGLHARNSNFFVSCSLEKSFLEKALTVRLIANDISHDYIASGSYNVGQTEVYYNRKWSTNYYKLSLTYNFGKLRKVNYKNKSTGTSETRRAS